MSEERGDSETNAVHVAHATDKVFLHLSPSILINTIFFMHLVKCDDPTDDADDADDVIKISDE